MQSWLGGKIQRSTRKQSGQASPVLSVILLASLSAVGGVPSARAGSGSSRKPAFASGPEILKTQIQSDIQGAIDKNHSAKTYGEYNTSGYSAKDVFSNVRELRDANAWTALCQSLDALPLDGLALFEAEIDKPVNEGQLPCSSALRAKMSRFWQENSQRFQKHLAEVSRKIKLTRAPSSRRHPSSQSAVEERKISIAESPIVTRAEIKQNEIAITFNDGPDPNRTPRVLDILRATGIRATFFHVGEQIRAKPEIDHRLVNEKHTLGTHTFGHIDLSRADLKKAEKQILEGREEAEAASGVDAPFFRAPYGLLNDDLKDILKRRKMPVFQWNIDSQDWKIREFSALYDYILDAIEKEKGGVLVLHENQESCVAVLRAVIDELKSRGFTFIVFVPGN